VAQYCTVARVYSQASRNVTRLSDSGMRRLLRRSDFLLLPVVVVVDLVFNIKRKYDGLRRGP